MSTIKETAHQLIDSLPEDVSWEDIQYHFYVRKKIELGLADLAAGRTISLEEAERRMRKWTEL